MSETTPQTFANHAKFVPLYHFVAFGIVVINLFAQLWFLIKAPSFATGLNLAMALAIILIAWFARTFPLSVQNRVIRLEERLRLERLLPEELRGRIGELTVGQLVGLRFASDGEVGDLVRRVLAGELKTNDQIKREVKSWRADHVRA